MSDISTTPRNKLWTSPLRDLLRGRVTGRLEWQSRLAAAELPAAVGELISRVVKRTRLWRLEKAAVADELIAHFSDGVAAGTSATELIERFGDERSAAKLIRRAKRRNRPLAWHIWNAVFRATAVLLAIYLFFLVRFVMGRPGPALDYVAVLNAPVLKTSEIDRAWPVWRQAILAAADPPTDTQINFSKAIGMGIDAPPWAKTIDWLNHHTKAVELARQAGAKPLLGFVYGPDGSQNDSELHLVGEVSREKGQLLIELLLPHLKYCRVMANVLSLDARRGAELHDGARAEADLLAMLGFARQLHDSDGILVTQLVALGIDRIAVQRLQHILSEHPEVLSDGQLIRFAHVLSGPRVAADLASAQSERYFFDDLIHRMYTDDGHGDGRMTLEGARLLPALTPIVTGEASPLNLLPVASSLPLVIASRAEMLDKYNQFMDQSEANLREPMRQVDWSSWQAQFANMRQSPVQIVHFVLVNNLFPSLESVQKTCERYLGDRDGALVGIALELYHRRHGKYPASLSELTPDYVPEVPADRITGDPVKYRLINGKPIVYSVGADRIDDGGKRIAGQHELDPARWNVKPADAARGDWVLYPPVPTEGE
jgi:hypothetical protein